MKEIYGELFTKISEKFVSSGNVVGFNWLICWHITHNS